MGGLEHLNLEEGLLLRHLSGHEACHQVAVELPTGILVGFHHGVLLLLLVELACCRSKLALQIGYLCSQISSGFFAVKLEVILSHSATSGTAFRLFAASLDLVSLR